jgi:hypothetical protein
MGCSTYLFSCANGWKQNSLGVVQQSSKMSMASHL